MLEQRLPVLVIGECDPGSCCVLCLAAVWLVVDQGARG